MMTEVMRKKTMRTVSIKKAYFQYPEIATKNVKKTCFFKNFYEKTNLIVDKFLKRLYYISICTNGEDTILDGYDRLGAYFRQKTGYTEYSTRMCIWKLYKGS